jgi:DNA-binding GntR family transcriptional regulator
MIAEGEFLPGQQLRQESLAQRLGVSRLPIREALKGLEADGLVNHVPNVGYSVARLSVSDFHQVYFMRRLLESAVLESLPMPSPDDLRELEALNEQMAVHAEQLDLARMRQCNVNFHFAIFRLSPHNLMVDTISRLWDMASPYHAMYLTQAETRKSVLREHARMIDALRRGDLRLLVKIMDEHRHGTEVQLNLLLAPG